MTIGQFNWFLCSGNDGEGGIVKLSPYGRGRPQQPVFCRQAPFYILRSYAVTAA